MKYILFKDWEVTKRFKDRWLQNSLICYLRFVVTSEVNMLLKMSTKLDLTIIILIIMILEPLGCPNDYKYDYLVIWKGHTSQ
jgi:hypothetical protein